MAGLPGSEAHGRAKGRPEAMGHPRVIEKEFRHTQLGWIAPTLLVLQFKNRSPIFGCTARAPLGG